MFIPKITPKGLREERENTRAEAIRSLNHDYNPTDDTVFLIVEGKDDHIFYNHICHQFPKIKHFKIIIASGRDNVIHIYKTVDWTYFSKTRVFFFVDKDLSDIVEDSELSNLFADINSYDTTNTQKSTPKDLNFYVTDSYSIENLLFTRETLITVIPVLYDICLEDEAKREEFISRIGTLYDEAYNKFLRFFNHVMSWILYWKTSECRCMKVSAQYDNLNTSKLYTICQGRFEIKNGYSDTSTLENFIHSACNVNNCEYRRTTNIDLYTRMIEEHGGIERNIRGKYLKKFFLSFLESIKNDHSTFFSDRIKENININENNAVLILCRLLLPWSPMTIPDSLLNFMSQLLSENQ